MDTTQPNHLNPTGAEFYNAMYNFCMSKRHRKILRNTNSPDDVDETEIIDDMPDVISSNDDII
jgi:hypothetical protein